MPLPPTTAALEPSDSLLSVRGVTLSFGGIKALQDVSFDVTAGSICGLIGPNGAGKTSLFNCLSRLYTCTSGEIHFRQERITAVGPPRVAQLGIGRTFQNRELFRTRMVLDNVKVGRHCRTSTGFVANALRLPHVRHERRDDERRTREIFEFLDLDRVDAHEGGRRWKARPWVRSAVLKRSRIERNITWM